jgi:hypothetical protein
MGVDAGPVSYHTVSKSEYASVGIQYGSHSQTHLKKDRKDGFKKIPAVGIN